MDVIFINFSISTKNSPLSNSKFSFSVNANYIVGALVLTNLVAGEYITMGWIFVVLKCSKCACICKVKNNKNSIEGDWYPVLTMCRENYLMFSKY